MRLLPTRTLVLSVVLMLGICVAQAKPAPILYQHPTVDANRIVFAYAGNLWSVERAGGVAYRLTSGGQQDSAPIFSPNGKLLAFTGEHHGNQAIYVMPADGGAAAHVVSGSECDGRLDE